MVGLAWVSLYRLSNKGGEYSNAHVYSSRYNRTKIPTELPPEWLSGLEAEKAVYMALPSQDLTAEQV